MGNYLNAVLKRDPIKNNWDSRVSVNDKIECKIYFCIEELEVLREVWENMNHNPNANIDYYKALITSSGERIKPCVITFAENNIIKAILVGRIENKSINITIGYKTFWRFEIDSLTILFGGVLGDFCQDVIAVFFIKIKELFSEKRISLLFINFIDDKTDFFKLVGRNKAKGVLTLCGDKNLHWKMQCPDSIDEFYKTISYKFRKNLNRAKRKIANNKTIEVDFRDYTKEEDVDTFLGFSEEIAKKSYQRGIGVGFQKSFREELLTNIAAKLGWLFSYVLFLDNIPAAFERIYKYKGTLFCGDAAYDPKFRNEDVGTNLFLYIIEEACKNREIKEIDFGFGDADYKRRFGSSYFCERQIYIFNNTFRNYFIYFVLKLSMKINSKLKAYTQKMGVLQKIKRRWREVLTPKHINVK
jgi:hypothetical protein